MAVVLLPQNFNSMTWLWCSDALSHRRRFYVSELDRAVPFAADAFAANV